MRSDPAMSARHPVTCCRRHRCRRAAGLPCASSGHGAAAPDQTPPCCWSVTSTRCCWRSRRSTCRPAQTGRHHSRKYSAMDSAGAGIEDAIADVIGKVFAFVLGLADQHLGLPAIGEHHLAFQATTSSVVDISVVRRGALRIRYSPGYKPNTPISPRSPKQMADLAMPAVLS